VPEERSQLQGADTSLRSAPHRPREQRHAGFRLWQAWRALPVEHIFVTFAGTPMGSRNRAVEVKSTQDRRQDDEVLPTE